MVRLILTERLKAACQLALPSLPPSPSRTEIEAALAPPTEEELKYKDYLAEKAKKDLEAKKKNAVNLDAIPTIGEAPKTPDADEEEPGLLPPPPRTLSHKAVKALSEFLLNNVCQDLAPEERQQYTFSHLIKQGGMYLESPKPRIKSEALLKILNEIKRKQQEEEYQRMKSTGGLSGTRVKILGFQLRETVQEFRRTGRWVSGIVNAIFSIVAVFFGGLLLGAQMSRDWGMRVLVGFGCAFVVLIAEAYFFYFYNLVPEVTDNKEPMFEFQKKKAKPKAKVGPNKEALERNRAAAEAYALEASAVTKSELKTQ